jgi:SAM-dependent methyltransferase
MTHADAVAFLKQASPSSGVWADIGAGTGTFTRALAELIGEAGTVYAIDNDPRALRRLEREVAGAGGRVFAVQGDMTDLAAIRELDGIVLTGALFANALHFTDLPERVLSRTAERLGPTGRVVVIEYDRAEPNPWVPHPLPFDRLREVARAAGLCAPERVAQRASRYHGRMYCAVLRPGE